jgi:Protein of unknown function (DUF2490)
MQRFTKSALRRAPGFLVIFIVALGAPCAAQDVDTPTPPPAGKGGGSVFAPSGWVELIVPVQEQIDLKLYGFYIGELKVPVAQVDVPVRLTKFLTVTPSYMYYSVPASGLNELAPKPVFTHSYEEHQFRIDGTVGFAFRKFEIAARNMYVRRFRPAPLDDSNRYRGRLLIAHPLTVKSHVWKPFTSYEAYYDFRNGPLRQIPGWNRSRVWSGFTVPVDKHVSFQPSYMWESSDGSKTVNYLLFALIQRETEIRT